MTKVAIFSDTHGQFDPSWKNIFDDCQFILHAGDFASEKVYWDFKRFGIPMYMVRGNCDHGPWAENIPDYLSFRIAGKMFFMIHDGSRLPFNMPDTDFVISGHTHIFKNEEYHGVTYLNPGSASSPRGRDSAGALKLSLEDDDSFSLERVHFQ